MEPQNIENIMAGSLDQKPGELDRFSSAVMHTHELTSLLEERLAMVTHAVSNDTSKMASGLKSDMSPHITHTIDQLNSANARLQDLLQRITL